MESHLESEFTCRSRACAEILPPIVGYVALKIYVEGPGGDSRQNLMVPTHFGGRFSAPRTGDSRKWRLQVDSPAKKVTSEEPDHSSGIRQPVLRLTPPAHA